MVVLRTEEVDGVDVTGVGVVDEDVITILDGRVGDVLNETRVNENVMSVDVSVVDRPKLGEVVDDGDVGGKGDVSVVNGSNENVVIE